MINKKDWPSDEPIETLPYLLGSSLIDKLPEFGFYGVNPYNWSIHIYIFF